VWLMVESPINSVAMGAETHVAATYDGLTISIYINGGPVPVTFINGTAPNTTPIDIDTKWPHTPANDPEVDLAIGDRMSGGGAFLGLIDEVAIFDKALSPQQIQAHYQAQFVGTCLDDPETILQKEWCLSALSKDLSGTLELAGSKSHQCHKPPCK